MRSLRENAGISRTTSANRGQGSRSGDSDSQRLQKIAEKMGNQDLSDHLKGQGAQRDQLLAFICSRLETVHGVQQKELQEMKGEREWFRNVAMGKDGYHLPDPTRWHECAQLFKRAAEALCRGDIGKGSALLEDAMDKEQAAYESLPQMVQNRLKGDEKSAANAPIEIGHVAPGATCAARGLPTGLQFADRILAVTDQMEQTSPIRRTGWWIKDAEEEEEEEEEEQD
jgi:hypothetical protein